jgi:hypothetical protein
MSERTSYPAVFGRRVGEFGGLRVFELGGRLAVPPNDIEGVGRFARVMDAQVVAFGIVTAPSPAT